jgi:hypothetical protein
MRFKKWKGLPYKETNLYLGEEWSPPVWHPSKYLSVLGTLQRK